MVYITKTSSFVKGARHDRRSFRPTAMSVAMHEAGIIPGVHMIEERPSHRVRA